MWTLPGPGLGHFDVGSIGAQGWNKTGFKEHRRRPETFQSWASPQGTFGFASDVGEGRQAMGRATQPPSKFLAALTTGNLRGLFPIHKWNANCHSSTLRRHRAHCCPPMYFHVRRCMDVLSQRPPIRLPMPYSDISLTRRMPLYPQQDCRQPKKRPIRAFSDSHLPAKTDLAYVGGRTACNDVQAFFIDLAFLYTPAHIHHTEFGQCTDGC